MLEILYYPEGNRGPVGDYLTELAKERPKAFARLALDLEVLGAEGLRSQQITVRPLGLSTALRRRARKHLRMILRSQGRD